MDTLGLFLLAIAIVGMAVEGSSCMVSENRPLSVGVLNTSLCVITLFLATFLRTGAIVLAPEFGSVMVQGEGPLWFVRLALVASGALATLCWYRVRWLNKWRANPWLRIVPGLLIGCWAATRVQALNPDDFLSLHVFSYDVWWPPEIVWLTLCLAQTMLGLAKIESRVTGLTFTAALVAPLAHFALVHQELSDPQSRMLWRVIEPSSVLLAVLFLAHAYLRPHLNRGFKRAAIIAIFCLTLLVAAIIFFYAPPGMKLVIDLLPAVFLLAALIMATIGKLRSSRPEGDESESPTAFSSLIQRAFLDFHVRRLSGIFFACALLVLPIVLTDLFSLGVWDRDVDIGILTFFWLSFSARLSQGALDSLPRLFKNGVLYLPALSKASTVTLGFLRHTRDSIYASAKGFTAGGAWAVAFRGALLTVFALVGLVSVSEIMNDHKLVIEPFVWKDGTSKDEDKIADRFSDGIVNALGSMRHELLPVLLLNSSSSSGKNAPTKVMPAVLDSGATQAAIAKSSDLKIGSVTIPLSLLAEPIQRVVRAVFDIHVVGGSLHKNSNGTQYIVLINSEGGDTWKLYGNIPPAAPKDKDSPVGATQKQDTLQPQAPEHVAAKTDLVSVNQQGKAPAACQNAPNTDDSFEALIDEAAFHIANSDPSFTAMGLTSNWKAYQYFRTGLNRWNCYQAYRHWGDLSLAVDSFRQAVQEDNTFAPAQYRLGIAMQLEGETDGAIKAFGDTVSANPSIVLAQTAEAQALDSSGDPLSYRPAIAYQLLGANRAAEARRLWAAVARMDTGPSSIIDRREAYFGLCVDRFNEDILYDTAKRFPDKHYLSYFFCSRAAALYFQLPSGVREDDQQKKVQAYILSWLANTLEHHDAKDQQRVYQVTPAREGESALWFCSDDAVEMSSLGQGAQPTRFVVEGSRLMKHALRFYRQSIATFPGTDESLLCNAAMIEAYLAKNTDGAKAAMRDVSRSTTAHDSLGSAYALDGEYSDRLQNAPALAANYFRLALYEYREAIRISPSNYDALNGLAYTAWQWFLDSTNGLADPPAVTSTYLDDAESAAREEVRLGMLRQDVDAEQGARDTLGEVLIARGRNEEAALELHKALQLQADSIAENEIRWDLAQALLCSAERASPPQALSSEEEATSIFAMIRQDESSHELRPFTLAPGSLNPVFRKKLCASSPDDPRFKGSFPIQFTKVRFQSLPGCANLAIVDAALESEAEGSRRLSLRVWGGGLASYSDPDGAVQLIPPSYEHRLYFAQVVDFSNSLHSPVISFDLVKDDSKASCGHGHLTLMFQEPALVPPRG